MRYEQEDNMTTPPDQINVKSADYKNHHNVLITLLLMNAARNKCNAKKYLLKNITEDKIPEEYAIIKRYRIMANFSAVRSKKCALLNSSLWTIENNWFNYYTLFKSMRSFMFKMIKSKYAIYDMFISRDGKYLYIDVLMPNVHPGMITGNDIFLVNTKNLERGVYDVHDAIMKADEKLYSFKTRHRLVYDYLIDRDEKELSHFVCAMLNDKMHHGYLIGLTDHLERLAAVKERKHMLEMRLAAINELRARCARRLTDINIEISRRNRLLNKLDVGMLTFIESSDA